MENFLMKCFYCTGAFAVISFCILFSVYIWDWIIRRCNRSWESCKYSYEIIMWYVLRRHRKSDWYQIRRRFLKGEDVLDFEDFKEHRKEFDEWRTVSDDNTKIITEHDNEIVQEITRAEDKKAIEMITNETILHLTEQNKKLTDAIRKHRKDCPDDDFEPDHELWALVEDE